MLKREEGKQCAQSWWTWPPSEPRTAYQSCLVVMFHLLDPFFMAVKIIRSMHEAGRPDVILIITSCCATALLRSQMSR